MRFRIRFGRRPRAAPPPAARGEIDPALRSEVVAFLRDWLPPAARDAYREMIRADPEHWMEDAHFAGGIVVRDALRGNGITERLLGVADLDTHWPALLAEALGEPEAGTRDFPGSALG